MPCILNLYYKQLEICQRNGIPGHKAGHLKTQSYAKHLQMLLKVIPITLLLHSNNSPGEGGQKFVVGVKIM